MQRTRGINGPEYESGTVRKSGQVLQVFELCKFEVVPNKLLITLYYMHKI